MPVWGTMTFLPLPEVLILTQAECSAQNSAIQRKQNGCGSFQMSRVTFETCIVMFSNPKTRLIFRVDIIIGTHTGRNFLKNCLYRSTSISAFKKNGNFKSTLQTLPHYRYSIFFLFLAKSVTAS